MLKKLLLIWFLIKTVFSTKLDGIDSAIDSEEGSSISGVTKQDLKKFFALYNVDKEDVVEYTNTYEDHHSNFKHLDKMNDKLTEVAGLIYEEDGKTPKNAAEVFDMSYEEYNEYKKKILPLAIDRVIKFEDINSFIDKIRT